MSPGSMMPAATQLALKSTWPAATGVPSGQTGGCRRCGGHRADDLLAAGKRRQDGGVDADGSQQFRVEALVHQVIGHAIEGCRANVGHRLPGQLQGDVAVDSQGFPDTPIRIGAVLPFPQQIDKGRMIFDAVAGELLDARFAHVLFEPGHLRSRTPIHQVVGAVDGVVIAIHHHQRRQRRRDG